MLRLISSSRLTRSSAPSAPRAKQIPNVNTQFKSLQVSQLSLNSKRFYAANRLYVGNVPWTTTENELRDLFAEFGKVSDVKIPTDRETGRAKGFAFITMETTESGSTAVSALDGKPFGGRTLRVNEAREREAGGGGFGGGSGGPRSTGGNGGGFNNRPPRRSFEDSNEQ